MFFLCCCRLTAKRSAAEEEAASQSAVAAGPAANPSPQPSSYAQSRLRATPSMAKKKGKPIPHGKGPTSLFLFSERNIVRRITRFIIEWPYPFWYSLWKCDIPNKWDKSSLFYALKYLCIFLISFLLIARWTKFCHVLFFSSYLKLRNSRTQRY